MKAKPKKDHKRLRRFLHALEAVNREHGKTFQDLAGIPSKPGNKVSQRASTRWQKRLVGRTLSDSTKLIREDRNR